MNRSGWFCVAIAVLLVANLRIHAETIFPAHGLTEDGDPISWEGTHTVFVGHYAWPDREPLGIYNNGARFETRADIVIKGCDFKSNTCTTNTPMLFGGLPPGSEVKLMTTGTLPGRLVSWNTDHNKVYYIHDWSGNSFRLSVTPDGPPINLDRSVPGNGEHGMSFAGYSHALAFKVARGVRFGCDSETKICTSELPLLYRNDARVSVYSTGQLPDGLYEFGGGRIYVYCLTYLGPTTFKLRPTTPAYDEPCSEKLPFADIKSRGSGTHYLFGAYYPGKTAAPEAVYYVPTFVRSVGGYPPGTVLSWRADGSVLMSPHTNNGYGVVDPSTGQIALFAKIPANTSAGDYRITVKTSEAGDADVQPNSFQYTLKAVTLPSTKLTDPMGFPKVPGLKTWEYVMTSSADGGGAALAYKPRCANRQEPQAPLGWADAKGAATLTNTGVPYPLTYSPGGEQQVWYYNDETFFRIAKYTGEVSWTNCGLYIANVMRDKFKSRGPGQPAYEYFPWTLVAAYRFTGDSSYKDAVISIADGGTYSGGAIGEFLIRENAYAFERRLAKRDVTGEEDYGLPYFADATIGQLYGNAVGSPDRTFNQPFMLGLAMRPLIRWYMISHDERIPYVIKLTLDKLWNDWYDHRGHHYYYNPEPFGERCVELCHQWTSSKLNNLVSPAYAWYWRLTGDETSREHGDDLFSHLYDDGYPYSAKEWSLGFYWGWDFVDWREGKKPAR